MVGDGVNKDDNDVTAGDIITVCQPAEQKRALPGLPSCLGSSREKERAQRLMYPFGFQFNSASLFTYSNFPVWAFVRRKTFWFVLPTLYLYYWLEWKHSVSSSRISGDLAPHSRSLTLFKMYCFRRRCLCPASVLCLLFLSPPVSSSVSPHPFLPHPCFLSPSPTSLSVLLQDSERKGFMNKLYAIQDVCISVQNALDEVASYGERIKKWVVSPLLGTRPTPLRSALLCTSQCFFSTMPGCPTSPCQPEWE